MRIKEQETHPTHHEHEHRDDDDDDDDDEDDDDDQLRHMSSSVFLFLCLSAWNDSASTGRILMKFDILIFFEILFLELKLH